MECGGGEGEEELSRQPHPPQPSGLVERPCAPRASFSSCDGRVCEWGDGGWQTERISGFLFEQEWWVVNRSIHAVHVSDWAWATEY
jgi:hypothetical protein